MSKAKKIIGIYEDSIKDNNLKKFSRMLDAMITDYKYTISEDLKYNQQHFTFDDESVVLYDVKTDSFSFLD